VGKRQGGGRFGRMGNNRVARHYEPNPNFNQRTTGRRGGDSFRGQRDNFRRRGRNEGGQWKNDRFKGVDGESRMEKGLEKGLENYWNRDKGSSGLNETSRRTSSTTTWTATGRTPRTAATNYFLPIHSKITRPLHNRLFIGVIRVLLIGKKGSIGLSVSLTASTSCEPRCSPPPSLPSRCRLQLVSMV
jgi:hypothetical protein